MDKYLLQPILEEISAISNYQQSRSEEQASNLVSESCERFKVHTAADALGTPKEIDWIIENLFSVGSVSLLVGKEGIGKTYVMLDAAVCVALGQPWIGFKAAQATALIIDEESGERRLGRRLGEVLRGEGGDKNTMIRFVSLSQLNLRNPIDADHLQNLIISQEAKFIVIDALVDVMQGGDENAAKDVNPIFQRLRNIAYETKSAIVVIHHTNKSGGYRGSSVIGGAVDLLLMMEKTTNKDILKFIDGKSRDIESINFKAEIKWEKDSVKFSRFGSESSTIDMNMAENYVINFLKNNGPSLLQDIMESAKECTSNAARQAVYPLVRRKIIFRTNPDQIGRGSKAIYDLCNNGAS